MCELQLFVPQENKSHVIETRAQNEHNRCFFAVPSRDRDSGPLYLQPDLGRRCYYRTKTGAGFLRNS